MKKTIILILIIVSTSLYSNPNMAVLDINAFINSTTIPGKVYKNPYSPQINGVNLYSSFVNMNNIFELLHSEIKIINNIIEIENPYMKLIQFDLEDLDNLKVTKIIDGEDIKQRMDIYKNSIVTINNEYYISLSIVRYLINGSLDQNEAEVFLYTPDFERLDIPATLIDCYKALNNELSTEQINSIKISNKEDLIKNHFGLGMWIRNKWIRPTPNRIAKLFIEYNIINPDDISMYIITGYYHHLNDDKKELEEIIGKPEDFKKTIEDILNSVIDNS